MRGRRGVMTLLSHRYVFETLLICFGRVKSRGREGSEAEEGGMEEKERSISQKGFSNPFANKFPFSFVH